MNEIEIKQIVEATISEADVIHRRTTQPNLKKHILNVVLNKFVNKNIGKSIEYSKKDNSLDDEQEKTNLNRK